MYAAVLGLVALLLAGCGYHLVHAGSSAGGPFAVTLGAVRSPDAALAAVAEEGARAELSRAGMLGAGAGAPAVLEVELVRVDETSEGIALAAGAPLARAVRVTAVGRARVRRPGGGPAERETGDVEVSETVARAGSVGGAAVARDEAGRAAARRLGEALARRVLGLPEPAEL
jgi:hypothetical protein